MNRTIGKLASGELKATDPTITPLIIFERTRAKSQIGEATIEEQHQQYKTAYEASMTRGNHERAATLAAWEIVDAGKERNQQLQQETQADFAEVSRLSPQHAHIMEAQRKKDYYARANQVIWQATRPLVPKETVVAINEALVTLHT